MSRSLRNRKNRVRFTTPWTRRDHWPGADAGRGTNRDEAYRDAPPDIKGTVLMASNSMKKNITKAIAELTGGASELPSPQRVLGLNTGDGTGWFQLVSTQIRVLSSRFV